MCACLARQVQKQATGILLPLFSQQNHLLFSSGPKSQSLCVEASTLSLPSADGEPHPRCRPAERAVSAAVVSERRPSASLMQNLQQHAEHSGRVAAAQQVKSSSTGAPARVASTQQQHLPPDALLVIVTNRSSPRPHTQKSRKGFTNSQNSPVMHDGSGRHEYAKERRNRPHTWAAGRLRSLRRITTSTLAGCRPPASPGPPQAAAPQLQCSPVAEAAD